MTSKTELPDAQSRDPDALERRIAELEQLLAERLVDDRFQAGQRRFFEQLITGEPLQAALETLVHAVEARTPGARCSVLLVDDVGKHLLHGAAPSLPDAYNKAIHGIDVGPTVGSCGTAVALGRTVIVTDIATDPLWKNFRDLAMSFGLRACWSVPFRGAQNAVLGTFAFYYGEPRAPTPTDIERINDLAHLAAIAVERAKTENALREAMHALSTPLIPISEHILVMPLIGALDSHRAEMAVSTVLQGVSATRARYVILDITGITAVNPGVTQALLRTASAVRLLGAEVILTGIQPEMAMTLVQLGVDLGALVTRRNLQQGIAYAMRKT